MHRFANFFAAVRDTALIVLAGGLGLVFCVILVVGFALAVFGAVVGAALLGAWDRLVLRRRRRP